LGGNGIAALVLASYGEFFGTNPYVSLVRRLANGILEMQEEDGSYFHILDAEDFSRKERSRVVYYDGEATYALSKAYSLTGDERYLEAAEKSVAFFIDNEYERFRDHWVAYSLNEITKHVHKQEYFDFALRNAQSNLVTIFNQTTPYHTYFELLMAAFNTYKRLKILCENNVTLHISDFFNEQDFVRTIWRRAVYMQNYYYYPEFAMYMKRPQRIVYAFNVRHQNWRVRIDDVQHFVGGYYEFCKNYRLLAKHLDGYGFSDEGIDRFLSEFGQKKEKGVIGKIKALLPKR
jgi:rhamnogalacturonyl hydrolase YesR